MVERFDLDSMLCGMKAANSSDLHLKVGVEPRYRIDGQLVGVPNTDSPDEHTLAQSMMDLIDEEQEQRYREEHVLHFSFGKEGVGRFRACYYQDVFGPAAAFRLLEESVPTLQSLNLPESIESFAHLHSGLVLVTGATGSGKSTTLAALIQIINTEYRKFVVSLEDPIEYVHPHKMSVIHQRGLHYDITDFRAGVEAAVQQNPDVLLVGELRDPETIRLTLSAAEAGILVFSTLHTNGAAESIDRVIDMFHADEQPQIRAMLSECLAGVVSQVLLRRSDGTGRVPATEVLVGTGAVTNMVREGKVQELANVIQSGKALGMHTMDESLERLVEDGMVDPDEAYFYARNKARLEGRTSQFRRRRPVGALGDDDWQSQFMQQPVDPS